MHENYAAIHLALKYSAVIHLPQHPDSLFIFHGDIKDFFFNRSNCGENA